MRLILYIFKSTITSLFFIALFSCGAPTEKYNPDPNEAIPSWKNQMKYVDKDNNLIRNLLGFGKKKNEKNITGSSLNINAYMWRASLKILSSVPLSSVDSASGIIITDWYNLNNNLNERIKISITIMSEEIRADGVKVNIFKQIKKNNNWQNLKANENNNIKLERAIIKQAALLSNQIQ